MGSNLHKLRFMQKGNQPEVRAVHVVERLLDEEAAWVAEGFEEVHKAHDQEAKNQAHSNLKIRYASRKSFNGANPFIERYMQTIGKRR